MNLSLTHWRLSYSDIETLGNITYPMSRRSIVTMVVGTACLHASILDMYSTIMLDISSAEHL